MCFNTSLKMLYDSYPNCFIRASGSSSLLLSSGIGDLSRRFVGVHLHYLVPHLGTNHFRLMNAILGYLSQSDIPVLQVNSLCREWNIGKEKLYSLLHAMEQSGLLRMIRKERDHSAMPAKPLQPAHFNPPG